MMATSADGTVKKPDFIAAVAEKAGMSKTDAEKVRACARAAAPPPHRSERVRS